MPRHAISLTLICTTFVLLLSSCKSQRVPAAMDTPAMEMFDYDAAWHDIDSLEGKGLFQSALSSTRTVLRAAEEEENHPQKIKAVVYVNKYAAHLNEDGLIEAINGFETYLTEARGVEKSLVYSMTAELYSTYLQSNAWKLRDRTDIPGAPGEDIRTWSVRHLIDKINTYYLASVAEPRLKQVPVTDYALILTTATTDSLRPTMYDFVAHRAIDYFMQDYSFITEPVYAFKLTSLDYLQPASEFVDYSIDTPDERSYKRKALELLQEVIAFHLDDADPVALVDADLKRLQFVYQQLAHEDKDTVYISVLDALAAEYDNHPVYAEICYHRALFYMQRGQGSEAELHKWDLRTARQICEQAISTYPESYGAANCRNVIAQLTQQHLNAAIEEVWMPGDNPLVKIEYRNLAKAYLRVVKLDYADREKLQGRPNDEIRNWLAQQEVVRSQTVGLTGTEDLRQHTTETGFEALSLGYYALLISGDPDFPASGSITAYTLFHVSGIAFWNTSVGNENRFVIVDRATGAPLHDAHVEFYTHEYNAGTRRTVLRQIGSATTSREGIVTAPRVEIGRRSDILLRISAGEDILFLQEAFYSYRHSGEPRERQAAHIFTDRAIYRPGQTIYFKAYLMHIDGDNMPSVAPNSEVTITLFDANGQKVEDVQLTSNSFGTVSGSFKAPAGRLLGTMRINAMQRWSGSTSFRVEEYKRPTFEVKIDSAREAVALNDTVQINGTASTYAGVPLDQATVSYRVTRRTYYPYYPWWMHGRWFPPSGEMEIAFGEIETAEDGSFTFSFFARGDEQASLRLRPEFIFEVEADVTDIAGETRSTTKQIVLGHTGFRANVQLDEYMDLKSLESVAVRAENLNGEPLGITGIVTIEKLETPARPLRERRWEVPDEPLLSVADYQERFPAYAAPGQERVDQWDVATTLGTANFSLRGDDQIDIGSLLQGAGAYKLTMRFESTPDDTLTQVHYVHCFDAANGVVPAYQLIQKKASPAPHQPGDTYVHTMFSAKASHLYQYVDRSTGLSAGWSQMTDGKVRKEISITEADRGGLSLQTAFVFDSRLHVSSSSVPVPWTNKELHFEYLSYRDVTEPGADEEWRIRITGEQNDGVVAEMLATMYDASLDAFVPHAWRLRLYPTHRSSLNLRGAGFDIAHMRFLSWINQRGYYPVAARHYRQLNWFNFPMYGGPVFRRDMVLDAEMAAAPQAMEKVEVSALGRETDDTSNKQANEQESRGPESEDRQEEIQPALKIRSDMQETVFFFPHIETDPDGTVTLRFQMREALTRWKFLGLGHTQDLKYGLTEKEIVTRKKLMVFPNVPRFLRQKDTLHLSTKVFNASEKALNGTVTLTLLDAATGTSLNAAFGMEESAHAFALESQSSGAFQWRIHVPDDFTRPVTYRFVATTGTFGDGEEGLLPVLSDRIFVTESLAMYVHAESTKVYRFEALDKMQSGSLDPHNFTLEFTSNPAWYAVQALPYLQEYPHACVEQRFSRLYANLLARHVTSEFPAIREVFAQWEEDPTGESLMSNLAKNKELKSALLEETPWVSDAMSEEAQMRNIATLFDLERLAAETVSTLQFLQQVQLSNGGFPWFAGGRDNWYITQYLVEGFGHLQKLGALDLDDYPELKSVLQRAITYLDARATEYYNELVRRADKGEVVLSEDNLSHIITHYLYARSFFEDQSVAGDAEKAHAYYLGQSEKYWTERPLYVQALIALSLARWNASPEVSTMVQSFRERSLYDEELGRYWKVDPGYYWYQLPIERHALMIELFDELTQDQKYIDELRLWLLNNKRTNRWATTKSTAAAVYALLLHSESWLEGVPVQITVGGEEVPHDSPMAGAEYIKESWPSDEITRNFGEIRLENPNNHIAWGGAYFQYFEDLDKITAATETPLKIAKGVWKEVRTDRGPELHPVDGATPLAVGDKLIVRIELEVDREMEFVHLKDMRGSGLEPLNVLSTYKWQGGLGYYESTGDLATHFFMDRLPRGKWVFEYPLRVTHTGNYANGIATLQSMYAPEFSSHSESVRLVVE